jgi:glycolate oxidase FAD binding subunit
MAEVLQPADGEQVREVLAWAAAEEEPIAVQGRGSKTGLGRPMQTARVLDLSQLTGISLYEPEELVLRAGAGTALSEVQELVAGEGQQLAFEPPDYGSLLGSLPGAATIAGAVACNLSGPRRIQAGAARDHFLGLKAVSGRGEHFKSGGRVVKNVTGYDICKLLAGSYGTLGALTEVTVKVLPAAEKTRTVLILGLDDRAALAALREASGSAHEVSGLAHLPASEAARSTVSYVADADTSVTALRIEGPGPSVEHRCVELRQAMAAHGPVEELHSKNSAAFWREVRDVGPFVGEESRMVWRLSLPPAAGAEVVARIAAQIETRAFYDWAGGLVWLSMGEAPDAGHETVRAALVEMGGHALLVKAPAEVRAVVPVFQPLAPSLAALTARVKESFDPRRILNPGRMYAGL